MLGSSHAGYDAFDLDYSIGLGQQNFRRASGDYNIGLGHFNSYQASGNYNIALGYYSRLRANGSNNIEIVTQGDLVGPLNIANGILDNKLHIENTIIGDTSSKLLAIGNVGSADLTPDATLEVKPNATTDVGIIV